MFCRSVTTCHTVLSLRSVALSQLATQSYPYVLSLCNNLPQSPILTFCRSVTTCHTVLSLRFVALSQLATQSYPYGLSLFSQLATQFYPYSLPLCHKLPHSPILTICRSVTTCHTILTLQSVALSQLATLLSLCSVALSQLTTQSYPYGLSLCHNLPHSPILTVCRSSHNLPHSPSLTVCRSVPNCHTVLSLRSVALSQLATQS